MQEKCVHQSFRKKPLKRINKYMFFLIGGMFMATGGTDHMIRVYYLGADTPMKVSEMDAHTVKEPYFLKKIIFLFFLTVFFPIDLQSDT